MLTVKAIVDILQCITINQSYTDSSDAKQFLELFNHGSISQTQFKNVVVVDDVVS